MEWSIRAFVTDQATRAKNSGVTIFAKSAM